MNNNNIIYLDCINSNDIINESGDKLIEKMFIKDCINEDFTSMKNYLKMNIDVNHKISIKFPSKKMESIDIFTIILKTENFNLIKKFLKYLKLYDPKFDINMQTNLWDIIKQYKNHIKILKLLFMYILNTNYMNNFGNLLIMPYIYAANLEIVDLFYKYGFSGF